MLLVFESVLRVSLASPYGKTVNSYVIMVILQITPYSDFARAVIVGSWWPFAPVYCVYGPRSRVVTVLWILYGFSVLLKARIVWCI